MSTVLKAIVVVNGWIVHLIPNSSGPSTIYAHSGSLIAFMHKLIGQFPFFTPTDPVCNPEVNPGGSLGCFFARTYYQEEDGSYPDSPFSKMFLFTVMVTFVKLGQMN